MESTTEETEKRQLSATVQKRLIGNKNTIRYKDLLDQKIPTFLKNYLQNSVQKIIHTEEPIQFNNSKRFDFEYEKIGLVKNELIKAFEEATIFTREELVEIINRTVQLQFDLLVKPSATLLNIFYRQKSDRIQNDILKILEGLNDSRIYFNTLKKNIEEYDQYHIVEENFKHLLDKTEKDVYQKSFVKSILSDIDAIVNFLNLIHGVEKSKIDVNLLKLLLSERKFKQYLSNLINFETNNFDVDVIAAIFAKFVNRPDKSNEDGSKAIADEIVKLSAKASPKTKSEITGAKPDERYRAEIEQSFEKEKDNEESDHRALKKTGHKETAISKKDRPKKFPKVTNSWKDPLDMIIERSKIEEQPEGPLISLKDLIDEKSERILMKRIFCSDPHDYHEVIRKLESIDNWKDAKKLIDSELYVRSIEPFSREALMLGDLVFNRYFPTKH
ncbi:MAG: hypothetical protein MUC94_00205 [bacterium]|jgi:hypothetical protein|nr:hypothetical protein [bacterium]